MAIAAMQEKLTGTEEELRQSEGQRRRLQQELATIQEMVNSGTFFRERIADLESQLAVTKLQADDDRRSLREQVSQKEGAILRQVCCPVILSFPCQKVIAWPHDACRGACKCAEHIV